MSKIVRQLQATMTPEKKKIARNDYFAFYIGRPISYLFTIPFLWVNASPKTVTIFSIIIVWIAAGVMFVASNIKLAILAWVLFFIWNLLDGVDGNIARLKNIQSDNGSVWDAMSGYFAMFLLFASVGFYTVNSIGVYEWSNLIIAMSVLSGLFQIFPRLVLQKARNTQKSENVDSLVDKSTFGLSKILALNLTSVTGGPQLILLLSILTGTTGYFVIFYFIVNGLLMIASLTKILE